MEFSPTPLQPGNGKVPVSRKRNRLPVSCGNCRRRKQKCNRASPCDTCFRSGDAPTCSYASDDTRDNNQSPSNDAREDVLMARIDRLEKILMSVVASGAQIQSSAPTNTLQSTDCSDGAPQCPGSKIRINGSHDGLEDPEVDQLAETLGIIHVDQTHSKSVYVGGAHWLSIMYQIEEFKSYLVQNHNEIEHEFVKHEDTSSELVWTSSSLLRGIAPPATRQELLSGLPPRDMVDNLVKQFFKTYSTNSPFIHEPTFRKECLAHWNDPTKTTIAWLGLLYAMMRLAELSYVEAEDDTLDLRRVHGVLQEYKMRTIQCLVAADYTNPTAYTLETLLLYTGTEWLSSQDAGIEISLVLGIAIRLAMRMGIHRDSNAHPKITPFQGEMRRRIWATLHEMDILYSFQLSLPTIIRRSDCDCGFPQNISDDDFEEETAELPSSRSLTEATAVSYMITKYRFTLILGEILTLSESLNSVSPKDVLKYEQALQEAQQITPPHLRITAPGATTTTNMFLAKQRIGIDRIYQLSQCILHRKFLQRARYDANFTWHRRFCVDAAMILLNHQATIYLECDSTYPQNIEKRHLSTLSTHDFFVAGMAIALDLHFGYKCESMIASSDDINLWGYDRKGEMITALETSIQFWRICKDYSVEAAKAYGLFSFVLMKAKKAQWLIDARHGNNPEFTGENANQPKTDLLSNPNWMDGIDGQDGFDWGPWNANSADNGDFESLLNWSPKSPDSRSGPNPMESS